MLSLKCTCSPITNAPYTIKVPYECRPYPVINATNIIHFQQRLAWVAIHLTMTIAGCKARRGSTQTNPETKLLYYSPVRLPLELPRCQRSMHHDEQIFAAWKFQWHFPSHWKGSCLPPSGRNTLQRLSDSKSLGSFKLSSQLRNSS